MTIFSNISAATATNYSTFHVFTDNDCVPFSFDPAYAYAYDSEEAWKESEMMQKKWTQIAELRKKNKMYRIAHNHHLDINDF